MGNKNPETDGSSFAEPEAQYSAGNFLGRLATVSSQGQPHAVAAAYSFDGATFAFSGWSLAKSTEFRNMMADPRVAFVVGEIVSVNPWIEKRIEAGGKAQIAQSSEGVTGVSIIPVNISSWGLGE